MYWKLFKKRLFNYVKSYIKKSCSFFSSGLYFTLLSNKEIINFNPKKLKEQILSQDYVKNYIAVIKIYHCKVLDEFFRVDENLMLVSNMAYEK